MKVAVYSRPLKKENRSYFKQLVEALRGHGFQAIFSSQLEAQLAAMGVENPPIFRSPEQLKDVEFILTLGGDGTILDTLNLLHDYNIPVLGINLGRLGFLASIAQSELERCLKQVRNKEYEIEERTLLYCEQEDLKSENQLALNEFTITNLNRSKLIAIRVEINGEYLNTYWADGLIISTPTGSTGYSLSCGGPVLLPDSKNFIITPIAPHNLNVRPIVVPDDVEIRAEVLKPKGRYLLSMDSRSTSLKDADPVIFRKSKKQFQLLRLDNDSFILALRSKLLWGQDMRTYKIGPDQS